MISNLFIKAKLRKLLGTQLEELFSILGVDEKEDLHQLEIAYSNLRRKEKVRNAVMALQRRHGLPFAPNDSLGRTVMRIRLKETLKKNQFSDDGGGNSFK